MLLDMSGLVCKRLPYIRLCAFFFMIILPFLFYFYCLQHFILVVFTLVHLFLKIDLVR